MCVTTSDVKESALECSSLAKMVAHWRLKFLKLRASAEAVALENKALIRERDEYKAMAFRDPLTGLLNRRGFNEFYTRICAEETRDVVTENACVAIIDGDYFKRINDTYGHLSGDEVLKALANCIQKGVRQTDLVCRFGGEEFIVFLHKTAKKEAQQIMERIRGWIESDLSVKTDASLIRITVSIGIAECQYEEKFDRTLERADQALYAAKDYGKNQVVCA